MKRWMVCAAVVFALAWPATSEASNLGISVNGNFVFQFGANINNFDPTMGPVPPGFGNSAPGTATVVVAEPLVEFGYHAEDPDGMGGVITAHATANFTAQQLIVTYSLIGDYDQASPWTMTFTSAAFTNLALSEVSDTLGVTGSLQGNQLTVVWPSPFLTQTGVPTAVFDLGPRAVPEPASLLLLATGVGAALRYRRRARS